MEIVSIFIFSLFVALVIVTAIAISTKIKSYVVKVVTLVIGLVTIVTSIIVFANDIGHYIYKNVQGQLLSKGAVSEKGHYTLLLEDETTFEYDSISKKCTLTTSNASFAIETLKQLNKNVDMKFPVVIYSPSSIVIEWKYPFFIPKLSP